MGREPAKSYHHGDLREALVKAGRAILEEEGLAGLTLRACARKAGVSHAAPQHHYAGVAALLADIAASGFEDFTRALDAAAERVFAPMESHLAMCRAYLSFAAACPALYRLMFDGSPGVVLSQRLQAAMGSAWVQLTESIADIAGPDPDNAKAIHVWSLLHGLAMLRNARRLPPLVDHDQARERLVMDIKRLLGGGG